MPFLLSPGKVQSLRILNVFDDSIKALALLSQDQCSLSENRTLRHGNDGEPTEEQDDQIMNEEESCDLQDLLQTFIRLRQRLARRLEINLQDELQQSQLFITLSEKRLEDEESLRNLRLTHEREIQEKQKILTSLNEIVTSLEDQVAFWKGKLDQETKEIDDEMSLSEARAIDEHTKEKTRLLNQIEILEPYCQDLSQKHQEIESNLKEELSQKEANLRDIMTEYDRFVNNKQDEIEELTKLVNSEQEEYTQLQQYFDELDQQDDQKRQEKERQSALERAEKQRQSRLTDSTVEIQAAYRGYKARTEYQKMKALQQMALHDTGKKKKKAVKGDPKKASTAKAKAPAANKKDDSKSKSKKKNS